MRRVERLNSRAGIFALSIIVWHGTKIVRRVHEVIVRKANFLSQVIQLTALRPTADAFCKLLRDALKAQLDAGQMKYVKSFAKTLYSEALIAPSSTVADTEREDGSLLEVTTEKGGKTEAKHDYHGGLGLTFKFPGDAKKWVMSIPTRSFRDIDDVPVQAPRGIEDQTLGAISQQCVWCLAIRAFGP